MRWVRKLMASTVVVNLTTEGAIRGVLVGEFKDVIVLANASFLVGETVSPIDGDTAIPRERIAFIQSLDYQEAR